MVGLCLAVCSKGGDGSSRVNGSDRVRRCRRRRDVTSGYGVHVQKVQEDGQPAPPEETHSHVSI